ncbi:MAG: HpcH/HpaI aldolase family protein [Dehalococcoidia bacterium]|jgi:2-keto-3-deoxy-L-rhamnonate aldolase RhmA
MKGNPLKAGVRRGELQVGTWVNILRNPASLTMFKEAGLDFVRLDMEHSSPSIETVADFAVMGRALDFPVMVRPPEANREWITRLLDVGIYNLHCPQVDTPEHAAEIVAASKYTPEGSRGMSGASPGNDFDVSMPVMDRLKFTNDQVFITVMFESAEAFEHLDEIASMDGIDALTLGPQDLAQDLGVFGTPDQAKVLDEKRQQIVEAANKYGKTCAMLVADAEQARQWRDAGVLVVNYSTEVSVLMEGYRSALDNIKE